MAISPRSFSAAEYTILSETAFIPAADPGVQEPHGVNVTAALISAANTLHNSSHDEFSTYRKTQVALKSQLLAAVDDAFVNKLIDPLWGYGQATVLQLLTHLRETYGPITPDQLDKNAATLVREWNPDDPLERLWQRVPRECRSFALAGGDEITEAAAVRKTLLVLEKTGVFADAARDWRKPPPLERTWAMLQKLFKVANNVRKRLLTTEGAGYYSANAAQAPTQLEQAMAALVNLTATTNAATDATPARPNQSATTSNADWHYCWSHGLGQSVGHTSCTCATRSNGHREDTVFGNMLGGNNTINQKRGERAVYRCSYNNSTNNT